jgi:hypothetical protein
MIPAAMTAGPVSSPALSCSSQEVSQRLNCASGQRPGGWAAHRQNPRLAWSGLAAFRPAGGSLRDDPLTFAYIPLLTGC